MERHLGIIPPPEGFVQTAQFNFERYTRGKAYIEVNRQLVARALQFVPTQRERILTLDVATGHGMVPSLITEIAIGSNRLVGAFGVDLDRYAIEQAKLKVLGNNAVDINFLVGDATRLPQVLSGLVLPESVDYTSIHDAIHEIRDDQIKADIIKSQAEMLKPCGVLSLNSAFTTQSIGRGWAAWQIEFMKLTGAQKSKVNIADLPIHTPDFYRELIIGAGLIPIHEALVNVPQDREALSAISEYPPFVLGFTQMMEFPRQVTLEEAVLNMQASIDPTLKRLKIDALPRSWYEIIAQKPKA